MFTGENWRQPSSLLGRSKPRKHPADQCLAPGRPERHGIGQALGWLHPRTRFAKPQLLVAFEIMPFRPLKIPRPTSHLAAAGLWSQYAPAAAPASRETFGEGRIEVEFGRHHELFCESSHFCATHFERRMLRPVFGTRRHQSFCPLLGQQRRLCCRVDLIGAGSTATVRQSAGPVRRRGPCGKDGIDTCPISLCGTITVTCPIFGYFRKAPKTFFHSRRGRTLGFHSCAGQSVQAPPDGLPVPASDQKFCGIQSAGGKHFSGCSMYSSSAHRSISAGPSGECPILGQRSMTDFSPVVDRTRPRNQLRHQLCIQERFGASRNRPRSTTITASRFAEISTIFGGGGLSPFNVAQRFSQPGTRAASVRARTD